MNARAATRRAPAKRSGSPSRGASRQAPWWDIWLTLSFLAASIGFSPVAYLASMWAQFSFDACGADSCNRALGGLGFALGAYGPSVVVLLLVVALILRRRMRRTGWQVGAIAIGVQAALLLISIVLVTVGLAA